MLYTILLILLVLFALYLGLRGLVYLFRTSWITGFIRGVLGLGVLILSVAIGLLAWDFYSYRQLPKEESIGKISFSQIAPQEFRVDLVLHEQPSVTYTLYGDQWQLDARFIKMREPFSRWGMKPLYRIERLNGRYYAIEDELNKPRSAHTVETSRTPIDAWKWVYEYHLPVFDAAYGTAIYLPMRDKAEFQLSVTDKGIISRPINDAAVRAVDQFIHLE